MANLAIRQRDNAALELIDDCLQQANFVRKELEPKWHENWGNYRVESPYGSEHSDKLHPFAPSGASSLHVSPVNFLKTPESHQGVNTLRAVLLGNLFGTRDYVLAAYSNHQINDVAGELAGLSTLVEGQVEVRFEAGQGRIAATMSLVDASDDPVTVPVLVLP